MTLPRVYGLTWDYNRIWYVAPILWFICSEKGPSEFGNLGSFREPWGASGSPYSWLPLRGGAPFRIPYPVMVTSRHNENYMSHRSKLHFIRTLCNPYTKPMYSLLIGSVEIHRFEVCTPSLGSYPVFPCLGGV